LCQNCKHVVSQLGFKIDVPERLVSHLGVVTLLSFFFFMQGTAVRFVSKKKKIVFCFTKQSVIHRLRNVHTHVKLRCVVVKFPATSYRCFRKQAFSNLIVILTHCQCSLTSRSGSLLKARNRGLPFLIFQYVSFLEFHDVKIHSCKHNHARCSSPCPILYKAS
jgi:hypothetical protein